MWNHYIHSLCWQHSVDFAQHFVSIDGGPIAAQNSIESPFVNDDIEGSILKRPHVSGIHHLELQASNLAVLLGHLLDDDWADVDVNDAFIAFLNHFFTEPRITAADL